jgi:histidinol-phosphate aminotransferase
LEVLLKANLHLMALVPKHIKELSPYKAGKPISEVQRELGLEKIVKLASNENPSGPPKSSVKAAQDSLLECHRYPDAAAFELREKLATRFKLKMENVVLGGGSEGVMSTIMRTFLKPGDEIVTAQNSFIGFRVLANASGIHTNWIPMKNYRYDLPSMADAINDYTKIIYLANPDNPTGTYFTVDEFDAFMSRVPERVLVLLDEAYFEYAQNVGNFPDSMHYRYDNVITLRTFSKAYGLAGFRVGYGFGHEDLIGSLLKVKLPFEPAIPAQSAAIAALDDQQYLENTLTVNDKGMRQIIAKFDMFELRYIPSVTNFVTLVFKDGIQAKEFTQKMLENGVILRHLIGFGLPECVRVTIGTVDENNFFIEKLNNTMEKIV